MYHRFREIVPCYVAISLPLDDSTNPFHYVRNGLNYSVPMTDGLYKVHVINCCDHVANIIYYSEEINRCIRTQVEQKYLICPGKLHKTKNNLLNLRAKIKHDKKIR